MTIRANTPFIIHSYHFFQLKNFDLEKKREKKKRKKKTNYKKKTNKKNQKNPIKNNKYLDYSFTESNESNQIQSVIIPIKKSIA